MTKLNWTPAVDADGGSTLRTSVEQPEHARLSASIFKGDYDETSWSCGLVLTVASLPAPLEETLAWADQIARQVTSALVNWPEIVCDPGILRGTPCIEGHRIPAAQIQTLAETQSLRSICEEFELTAAQVCAALDYPEETAQ